MQVVSWLPRLTLPFAAPSRPQLLEALPQVAAESIEPAVVAQQSAAPVTEQTAPLRAKIERPRPTPTSRGALPSSSEQPPVVVREPVAAPPRFALQLLRAGDCVVLTELPTGEPLQGRDPAYLLLKDLLRAAGLPDSPQLIGEPVRWPLLVGGNLQQGPNAALEFVQSFVATRLEAQPCSCLWLVGLAAIRFAGGADAQAYNRELQVEGLGAAWALPGLELLIESPERKAELWQAMGRVRQRWLAPQ